MENITSSKLNIWKLLNAHNILDYDQKQVPDSLRFRDVFFHVMDNKARNKAIYADMGNAMVMQSFPVLEHGLKLVPAAVNQTQLDTIDMAETIEPVPVAVNQARINTTDTAETIEPAPVAADQAQRNTTDTAETMAPAPAVVAQARLDTISTIEAIEPVPVVVNQAWMDTTDTAETIAPAPAVATQAQMNTISTIETIESVPVAVNQARMNTTDTAETIAPAPAVVTQARLDTISTVETIEPMPVMANQPRPDSINATGTTQPVPVTINQPQMNTINTTKTTDPVPITMNQPQLNTVGTISIDHDMKVMDKIKEGIERILFRNNNTTDISMGMGNEQTGTSFNTHNEPLMEEVSFATAWQNHPDLAKEIIDKLIQEININFKDEVTQMHIQLKPEYLGELDIMFSMKEEGLATTFWVQNTQIKELIESNLGMLRNVLGTLGIGINLINVFIKDENSWDKQKRTDLLSFGPRSLKEKKRQINIDITNIPIVWKRDAGVIDFVA